MALVSGSVCRLGRREALGQPHRRSPCVEGHLPPQHTNFGGKLTLSLKLFIHLEGLSKDLWGPWEGGHRKVSLRRDRSGRGQAHGPHPWSSASGGRPLRFVLSSALG